MIFAVVDIRKIGQRIAAYVDGEFTCYMPVGADIDKWQASVIRSITVTA